VPAPRTSFVATALCGAALSILSALVAPTVHAQSAAEAEALDEERAGTSRGGSYAWGDSSTDDVPGGVAGPAVHRYARVYGTIGAGATLRILVYEVYGGTGLLAPVFLQLRGGFFFEGDGDIQHGVGLGISTNLMPDGTGDTAGMVNGLDVASAWTFVPQYMLRAWFGDVFQLIGRIGPGVTASVLPNLGFEVGATTLFKFLAGLGVYLDVSFSMYFADQVHPLVSIEGGLAFDYELLP
jgi:hypothetical protein